MNDSDTDELILLHFQETLSLHGEMLADLLSERIERQHLTDSGRLLESINYDAFQENGNPGLRFRFVSYGRCVDMLDYKRNKHRVNTNSEIWGIKQNTLKKSSRKWYAKYMYTSLYSLISRLMYGLTEQETERLKGILQNREKKDMDNSA